MGTTHVTIGTSADFDEFLAGCADGGPAGNWPVPKCAAIGDSVVMLVPAIHGPFRAYGRVAGPPALSSWGNRAQYFVAIDRLVRLNPPVPVAVVQQALPEWAWLRYARSYTTVPDDFCATFWNILRNPPIAYDIEDAATPERTESVVARIVRDTAAANALKCKYDFQCQVCGLSLPYGDGQHYVEVHHIWPLGEPHNGPDASSNMLVLCPNHHALFDLRVPAFLDSGTIVIGAKKHKLKLRHQIARKSIDYYMKRVRGPIA